ncbi:hypothetical protein COT75_01955 [Candidatus Beckwithbacteria bacterium CG10_big_fil_rev_8_21_14_0_10_34_10]|uniref:HD domain-containing protein n=1 Tax=Candidatus Beckwithbacteria bacterium CG10_big_fil_rev_8_21_14_0_10_34_10 TaxID=1974495 RepID=A0A2H0W9U8_9BACT|nr:MAG: hypothetical protein COT75_01955 [Candidatus Beckwithbacteria bacterium CG10_big_fil_rev_8_21_14_0_10_34_10]
MIEELENTVPIKEAREIVSVDEFVSQCLNWHQQFNRDVWGERESYHDEVHIRATLLAGEKLIKAALKGNDPLNILKDLEKWNQDHPGLEIKEEEFMDVFKLAFAGHDLGNVAQGVSEKNGNLKLDFLAHYTAEKAEDRSQKIVKRILNASGIDQNKKERFLPLVLHLINETKYNFDGQDLFAVFSRVVDQMGSTLFSVRGIKSDVVGLAQEMIVENPLVKITPNFSLNFFELRFKQLVKDEKTRESIKEIWGGKPPDKFEANKSLVKAADWLRENGT